MGFTWIHLNQVNVGTNVAVGCASYQRWCTLTGVSTCATVNTCTKHKKRCSKGNPTYVYSTYTKDKRIRSTVRRRIVMPRTKTRGPKWHCRYKWEVYPTLPKHVKIRQFHHPNKLVQEVWRFYSQAEILSDRAGRLFLATYLEAFSTYLNTQLLHPPTTTTAPEDASIPDNPSEHHLGK